MQLGQFLKNQNGNLIDNKLLCIPGQGKATSLWRSILNNYSKCMQWLLYKILRSGLCAEICCNGGKKGLSGRIWTFSGPFQAHFGTLFVIFIIMLKNFKIAQSTKKFHNNSRAVSFFRYIMITFDGTFLYIGDF